MLKSVKIIKNINDRLIDATLSNLSTKHLEDFELVWKPQLQASVAEDRVWDWVRKERIYMMGGDPDPDRDGLPYFEWYRRQE